MLFLPAMEHAAVPQTCMDANLDFLNRYVDIQMENRTADVVSIDESLIQSGDFFGVIRLDGLGMYTRRTGCRLAVVWPVC
jgi:hypothetical protein